MPSLKETYPLYLNNKAQQPNTDLEVTDKFTGKVAFRTALATPEIIDQAIAGAVQATEPMAKLASYERQVHSPSLDMKIPSVIALRQYVRPSEFPAFTRFNLFLRDRFACQFCGSQANLTFDHVLPRRLGGKTSWENIATACAPCNMKKGGRTPKQAGMQLYSQPIRPTHWQLQQHGKMFPPNCLHETWRDWLYWDIELEA